MTIEGSPFDGATRQQVQRFLEVLGSVIEQLGRTTVLLTSLTLSSLSNRTTPQQQPDSKSPQQQLDAEPKSRGVESELGDVVVRYGSDPARNVDDKSRVKNLQVYEIVLPEVPGDKIYLSIDPKTNVRELVLPPKPPEQIPELLVELEAIAKGQLRPGTLVNYKPSGQLNYEKIYLAQTELPPNMSSVAQKVAETILQINQNGINKSENGELARIVESIERDICEINRNLKELSDKWLKRDNGNNSSVSPVQKDPEKDNFLEQFDPSLRVTLEKIEPNSRRGWRDFIRNVAEVVWRRERVSGKPNPKNAAQEVCALQALAIDLFNLARKLDLPERPGEIRGVIYTLKTYGPGYFSLEDINGNKLMSVHQESPFSPLRIWSKLPIEEVILIRQQLALIERSLAYKGYESIHEYLESTPPEQVLRNFGNFTPPQIASQAVPTVSTAAVREQQRQRQTEQGVRVEFSPLENLISSQLQVTPEPSKQQSDYEQER